MTALNLEDLDYRQILKNEFDHRKSSNAAYSLRSYARDLEISPSRLSEVLNGKGDLSPQSLMEIGRRLGLPSDEVLALKAVLELKNNPAPEVQKAAEKYLANYSYGNKFRQLPDQTFKILADWYHFAILSAMEMDFYDGSAGFLSRVLRLDPVVIQEALARMVDHHLINVEDGKYSPSGEVFSTSDNISSAAIRESHRQTLDQVKESLDTVDVSLRDVTSSTVCIDIDRIPEAKKMIQDFVVNMSRFLESGKKNAVYNINVQLHPISEVMRENRK